MDAPSPVRRRPTLPLALAAAIALASPDDAAAGGFSSEPHWGAAGLAVGDVDGDGTPDLVLSQVWKSTVEQRGRVLVLYGDPARPGRAAGRGILPCGRSPLDVVLADLDGNGLADVATADAADGTVTVLLQTVPDFFVRTTHPATARASRIAAGDLDQDGLPDLAVVGARDAVVLFQDPGLPGAFLPAVVVAADARAECLVIADADGDGPLDLVLGLDRALGFVLQDAAAPGTFLPLLEMPVPGRRLRAIASADLDGDGRADFPYAARGTFPDAVGAGVFVLLHRPGAGMVFDDRPVLTGFPQVRIGIADMDGDAVPDLVSGGRRTVAWFRQDPQSPGTFKRRATRFARAADGPLAVADLDADGAPDPVVALLEPFFVGRRVKKTHKFAQPRRFRE